MTAVVCLSPFQAQLADPSPQLVYRSLEGRPTRTIAAAWNPYCFESRLLANLRERLVEYGRGFG